MSRFMRPGLVLVVVCLIDLPAAGAVLRYHYAPVDEKGSMVLTSVESLGLGQRFAPVGSPAGYQPRPNQVVTFRHPTTGRPVHVPLALPLGTPQVQYRWSRIVYNYGTYTVEVAFSPDGTATVIYNSGLFRGL